MQTGKGHVIFELVQRMRRPNDRTIRTVIVGYLVPPSIYIESRRAGEIGIFLKFDGVMLTLSASVHDILVVVAHLRLKMAVTLEQRVLFEDTEQSKCI